MGKKVTFDHSPPPGTVNFGVGQPSDDLLPVDLIREATAKLLAGALPQDLNYGERQGDPGFRNALAGLLSEEYSCPADADSLIVTAGNSQALDFVCALFTRPGDTVIVEEPSYFLAFRIFEDHGLNIVSVPTDAEGMDINALEDVLTRTRPSMLYTIPSFHNPGGQSLSEGRRRRLAELSRSHDFLVVADEVYQMLWFEQAPPPALGTMHADGQVLSLGSFSKILAPGLRLGWIQTSSELMDRLLDSGAVNSGGSFNQFTSLVAREAIEQGLQQSFLRHLRHSYAERAEVMDQALERHFSGRARWLKPEGGYFFWLEFDASTDTADIRARADRFETGFQPGVNFSSRGQLRHCARLSFAHYGPDQIRDGMARLAQLFDEFA
jgi:DNA-binding transcriptional MocR family regulator